MVDDKYNPLVQDQKLLNEVKFAARDFASMADDLLRRMKIEYETVYNDYASTSQGIMLRDLVAWAYAGLIWYLDRTASDSFLITARTRSAVERLVEQIAYKMAPAAAAGATLKLTFPNGTSQGFQMKERWRYSGPSGMLFESYAKFVQPTPLSDGDEISIDVRQGESRTLTYTANGEKNQTYRLASIDEDRYLAVGTTEVWVDGALWTENDFLEFQKTNQYEVSYLANPPVVRFGDGSAGNIPPQGAEVKIRFLIIDGYSGNVKSNTIQTSVDTLTIAGENVVFTVNNPLKASGGLDPEEAESAKRFAPVTFAARGAAITQQDYDGLSNSFVDPAYGGVAKAYAINPRSRYDDIVFNELYSDIEGLLTAFNDAFSELEQSISGKSAGLDPLIESLQSSSDNLDTLRGQMVGWSASVSTAAETARDACLNAETAAGSAKDYADTSDTTLASIEDWLGSEAADGISSSQKSYLYTNIGIAKTASSNAASESQSASNFASLAKGGLNNSLIPASNNVSDAVADGGQMDILAQAISDDIAGVVALIQGTGGIQEDLAEIVGDGAQMYTDVMANLDDMHQRIGELFSDDCLSNYVQVPILALDSDGNYTAPSVGLRVGLQQYLNGIKEVTQVVEVVDGSSILIPVDISVRVKILKSYVPSEVISQIRAVITAALKGRDFDSPLYLSEPDTGEGLYDLMSDIAGIDYVNISIDGPSEYLLDGNLITRPNQVIIYGSLDVQDLDEVV